MNAPTSDDTDPVVEVAGRNLSPRDRYFWALGYKEPVESTARIEGTAKFVAGAVTGSCGVLLTALKITTSLAENNPVQVGSWWAVIGFWLVSLFTMLAVLFPLPYRTFADSPVAIEQTYRRIRIIKYSLLIVGTLLFFAGMLLGINTLANS